MSGYKRIFTNRWLYCWLFLWSNLYSNCAEAQSLEQIRHLGDSLLAIGSRGGYVELERYMFYQHDPKIRAKVCLQLGEFARKNEDWDRALRYFQRAADELTGDSTYFEAQKKAGLIFFLKEDYAAASQHFHLCNDSQHYPELTKEARQLELLSENMQGNWDRGEALALNLFPNEPFQVARIRELYADARSAKLKNPRTAKWLSRIIAGSGQMYAGKVGRGTLSFLLVYGCAALSVAGIVEGRILFGIFTGASLTSRFYGGGARYAESLALQWNERQKFNQAQILNTYLLELMGLES
ncbi:MAG: hypothetical protein H6581_28420 [Bacteroidia bacterium]|nr:hypothetical protein [Bacteroidia bacterium]